MLYPYSAAVVSTANEILSSKGSIDGEKHIKQILYLSTGLGELEEFWIKVEQQFNAINNNTSGKKV